MTASLAMIQDSWTEGKLLKLAENFLEEKETVKMFCVGAENLNLK